MVSLLLALSGCGSSTRASFRMYAPHGVSASEVHTSDIVKSSVQVAAESGKTKVSFALTTEGQNRFARLTRDAANACKRTGKPQALAVEIDGVRTSGGSIDCRMFPEGFGGGSGIELFGVPKKAATEFAHRMNH